MLLASITTDEMFAALDQFSRAQEFFIRLIQNSDVAAFGMPEFLAENTYKCWTATMSSLNCLLEAAEQRNLPAEAETLRNHIQLMQKAMLRAKGKPANTPLHLPDCFTREDDARIKQTTNRLLWRVEREWEQQGKANTEILARLQELAKRVGASGSTLNAEVIAAAERFLKELSQPHKWRSEKVTPPPPRDRYAEMLGIRLEAKPYTIIVHDPISYAPQVWQDGELILRAAVEWNMPEREPLATFLRQRPANDTGIDGKQLERIKALTNRIADLAYEKSLNIEPPRSEPPADPTPPQTKVVAGKDGRRMHIKMRYPELAQEKGASSEPAYPTQEKIIAKLKSELDVERRTILDDLKWLRDNNHLPPLRIRKPKELTNRQHRIDPKQSND